MAGLFGDLDWESVPENPFKIEAGTYPCHITDVKSGPTKDETKVGVTLYYTVDEGHDGAGLQIQDWKEVIIPKDRANPTAEEKRAGSFIRMRLEALGVPASKINSVKPEELMGKAVLVTVTEGKNDFPNIKDVQLNTEGLTSPVSAPVESNPFA
jgi:hypothetical protein